jgi:prepilin-type N-terminal cleavage/methylation domain-containing protein
MQRGNNKIMGKSKKRAGFTLIEVIVAMAILMVVILALVSSYYSYYNSVKQMTYRAIGQNLAEVMLEETRSLQVTILDSLVDYKYIKPSTYSGRYPTAWDYYKLSDDKENLVVIDKTEWDAIPEYVGSTPNPEKIPDGIPYPLDKTVVTNDPSDPASWYDSDPTVYDSGEYPTYETDSSLRLEGIATVFGLKDTDFSAPAWQSIMNSVSYKNLPSSIIVTPVYHNDGTTESYDYTILLNKETFPNYFRRIKITDLTPGVGVSMKIFKIEVTIYWNVGGTEQSVTVTGEKSFTP